MSGSALMTLYELGDAERRPISPYCWRIRLALQLRGVPFESVPLRFSQIAPIAGTPTVPTLRIGDRLITDSWNIALLLEESLPGPPLFGSAVGRGVTAFAASFADKVLHGAIFRMLVRDIFDRLHPDDQRYYRSSREKMLGSTLEEAQAQRSVVVSKFRREIQPLRLTLTKQKWLAGSEPGYADCIVLAAFQWARICSDFPLLAGDDPMAKWVDEGLSILQLARATGGLQGLGR